VLFTFYVDPDPHSCSKLHQDSDLKKSMRIRNTAGTGNYITRISLGAASTWKVSCWRVTMPTSVRSVPRRGTRWSGCASVGYPQPLLFSSNAFTTTGRQTGLIDWLLEISKRLKPGCEFGFNDLKHLEPRPKFNYYRSGFRSRGKKKKEVKWKMYRVPYFLVI
jgi:hypothetical protein